MKQGEGSGMFTTKLSLAAFCTAVMQAAVRRVGWNVLTPMRAGAILQMLAHG